MLLGVSEGPKILDVAELLMLQEIDDLGSMADGHPRALAGSAEASVAVAEIRDATGKLILNILEI